VPQTVGNGLQHGVLLLSQSSQACLTTMVNHD
jgi:hypothetical protein